LNGLFKDPAMAKRQKNKGVTLIELLIVVLLLAALAAIAVPKISHSAAIAKANTCKANINMLNCALERYYLANGKYPANLKKMSQDKSLFPDGEPRCPVTGEPYSPALGGSNRVDAAGHNH